MDATSGLDGLSAGAAIVPTARVVASVPGASRTNVAHPSGRATASKAAFAMEVAAMDTAADCLLDCSLVPRAISGSLEEQAAYIQADRPLPLAPLLQTAA